MSGFESDPTLELEALLDPTRLAAAWQVARERAPAAIEGSAMASSAPSAAWVGGSGGAGTASPDDAAGTALAVDAAGAPAASLPVALAHRQLLDELERMLVASPGLAAQARRVLSAPLARLAAVVDPTGEVPSAPLDLAAAETVLDDLEDVLQALLSAAGWPASGED